MSHFISVSLFSITLILFSEVTKVKLRPSNAHTHSPQGKWWQTKLKLIQIILGKLLSFISIVLSWKRLFNAKCSRSLKPNFGGYVLSMNTSKKVTFNLSVHCAVALFSTLLFRIPYLLKSYSILDNGSREKLWQCKFLKLLPYIKFHGSENASIPARISDWMTECLSLDLSGTTSDTNKIR